MQVIETSSGDRVLRDGLEKQLPVNMLIKAFSHGATDFADVFDAVLQVTGHHTQFTEHTQVILSKPAQLVFEITGFLLTARIV